ncbi:RluA family pseudouridine synthase [Paenibacillus sp. YN15]|uniref:RluA family pseudouridine synthase n=1 Tax=Paenibacillus sp. YN15 TaxID=1742774 RepID=UPI000DCF0328|nr:RluA family pseudouridine synthase [Paenibacillus sp. YN15]RAV06355.1 RluA family pseudouridine synthase [Paenibacillus sp. YN15]
MTDYRRKGEWLELSAAHMELPNDEWLAAIAARSGLPPVFLQKLERDGGVERQAGKLRLRLFPRETAQLAGEYADVQIVHEDDFCLVAMKPAGMAVHPSEPGQGGTLDHAVAYYYETTGQYCKLRHIHRLDNDTTGLVLYAKNDFAQQILDRAMREKAIRRTYWAIAQGRLVPPAGIIDRPIGKDRHHAKRRRVSPGGAPARTRYQTVEKARGAALVELELETGRTHQIRVHLQHAGAPLVGDALYGGSTRLFHRQALHGYKLEFAHPWSGEHMELTAAMPEEMAVLWSKLQAGALP